MTQKELNDFKREYFDLSKRILQNIIIHDSNTTAGHRRLVLEITEWLRQTGRTFYTRVFLKDGQIVDIVAPDLPKPFIEVRDTEKKKVKDYNTEFDDMRIFVDVDDPWRLL